MLLAGIQAFKPPDKHLISTSEGCIVVVLTNDVL